MTEQNRLLTEQELDKISISDYPVFTDGYSPCNAVLVAVIKAQDLKSYEAGKTEAYYIAARLIMALLKTVY